MSGHFTFPSGVQVRLVWTNPGKTIYTVLNFTKGSITTIDQNAANSIGSTIKTAFTSSNFSANYLASCALSKVGVRDVSSPGLAEFLDAGAAVPGTATASDLLPRRTAMCITHRT